MHTGTRRALRQFKHGHVTAKSEIGGQMELNEEEYAFVFLVVIVFTFIFKRKKLTSSFE